MPLDIIKWQEKERSLSFLFISKFNASPEIIRDFCVPLPPTWIYMDVSRKLLKNILSRIFVLAILAINK